MADVLTIGVDLGGTNTRAGLVSETGEIIGRSRCETRLDLGADGVVKGIVGCVRAALGEGRVDLAYVAGIGVGAPGPLDPFEGVIISPENLPCMHGVRLKDRLEDSLDLSVRVDNDANLAAYGEQWLGAGRGVDHFLCVTLGTGIGGGWVANGEVMHGFNGNAAEVGHVSLDLNGPDCPCGGHGCFELYASATAMVSRTRARMAEERPETSLSSEGLTTREIFEAAEAGDAFASAMFEETGHFLGVGLVSLVNVMNVEMIALCGGLARAGERLFGPARRTFQERGTVGVKEHVRIVPGILGDDAGILGAARMAKT
ncbi:MAG: ROK family protein [Candidatus Latescibacteria bacterium]|jgi:glucokinase|nr:ROK family protein [Candidatus Latescibacterota bacterium]